MLHSVAEVQNRITAGGTPLLLAGSEGALMQLPKGNWIGGTIPYFMDAGGGVCSESQIFVTEVPSGAGDCQIVDYAKQGLPSICVDAPDNGFSVLIIPAASEVHAAYAQDAPGYEGMFLKPVIGWISGVHLSQLGQQTAKVFNGLTGATLSDRAVAMHVTLPPGKQAELDIVNVFQRGAGDAITFPSAGFAATDCLVNGQPENLARYMARVKPDSRVPLTADYNGSIVNVSVQSVDEAAGSVNFYAPVFPGVEYRFAAPIQDYMAAFEAVMRERDNRQAAFACNCILNYLYANLEGKRTGSITGPITFGEIAGQLLNQTLVRLLIYDV